MCKYYCLWNMQDKETLRFIDWIWGKPQSCSLYHYCCIEINMFTNLCTLLFIQLFPALLAVCDYGETKCPAGSLTECEYFSSACRCKYFTCQDGTCSNDRQNCVEDCSFAEFQCASGRRPCVQLSYKCDGDDDCDDGSDEIGCDCNSYEFKCLSGRLNCVPISYKCDGASDCTDGSDEFGCATSSDSATSLLGVAVIVPVIIVIIAVGSVIAFIYFMARRRRNAGFCTTTNIYPIISLNGFIVSSKATIFSAGRLIELCDLSKKELNVQQWFLLATAWISMSTTLSTLLFIQFFPVLLADCSYEKIECQAGSLTECEISSSACKCKYFTCQNGTCTDDMRNCGGLHRFLEVYADVSVEAELSARRKTPWGYHYIQKGFSYQTCSKYFKMCLDGRCVLDHQTCPCQKPCIGGGCVASNGNCSEACSSNEFQCASGPRPCVQLGHKCDRRDDCDDASDEVGCVLNVCDGVHECTDNSDELGCASPSDSGSYLVSVIVPIILVIIVMGALIACIYFVARRRRRSAGVALPGATSFSNSQFNGSSGTQMAPIQTIAQTTVHSPPPQQYPHRPPPQR
ncbi:hypothetical protein CAPTEDRAFT_222458 [Capitella teleta]|uniref:Uncharacterized protein n=1 Tax=Capitella teleta TaxID=283909 RepID=R7TVR0_CAPTE|nr:hypothetical protein CAPTEDRAFT_222458 [Capitella teleta]|eukprot:ELT95551.1 hypothetical protein CAPTEDRAFT_222458 [Capitella teleta]